MSAIGTTHIITTDFNPLNKNKIANECRRHDPYCNNGFQSVE